MKPLGRKLYKDNTGGKHKDWWEDVCKPSKTLEKRNTRQQIEEGLDLYNDLLDEQTLDSVDYEECWGVGCDDNIACGDGICPVCNYEEYKEWLNSHGHCDQASWDCPDENNCPFKEEK
ncbi:hypothetical protein NVP1084O_141 [Vibrio phage 1.084.O._10N.261.49.F5]|nr:hypothetical protein NVP1084O_141 [Vibrio phage 1.084.O._10N.261.49.F5]